MACVECKKKKNLKDMEIKIRQLSSQGFDANRIAAMLGIQKSFVVEILAAPVKESTTVKLASAPKKKTKK
jgi:hypothetical protein